MNVNRIHAEKNFRKFIFFSLSDAEKFAEFYGTIIFVIWQKMAMADLKITIR